MIRTGSRRPRRRCALNFLAAAVPGLLTGPAAAVELSFGEVSGSWDTTVSYGQSWRTAGIDREIVGLTPDSAFATRAFGGPAKTGGSVTGRAFSENSDDGNQNFRNGLVSSVLKFTTELELTFRDRMGAFFRASGFKDMAVYGDDVLDRTPLSSKAEKIAAQDTELLDAYLWAAFDVGPMPAEVRIGEQVVSWGESTFVQNSINVINPFDVSRLRVPGAELREALKPVGMVWATISPTENTSVEGFYQFDYERTLIEPTGTFFSTNDFVGEGGNRVMLGFGDVSDLGTFIPGAAPIPGVFPGLPGALLPGGFDSDFLAVPRAGDNRPEEGDQYGIALRWFSPALNDTDFGFYFLNYHSRLPIISARTGSQGGAANAVAAGVAQQSLATGAAPAVAAGTGAFVGGLSGASNALGAAAQGVDCARAVAAGLARPAFAGGCVVDQYSQTARYFIEYPEDIQLFGISFNTQLGTSGWALQGEYSFRDDVPLQVDDVEILLAALTPINTVAMANPLVGAPLNPAFGDNQLGSFGPNQVITGFRRLDMSQLQFTASKVFGPRFKADQLLFIGEVAVNHVHDFPNQNVLRFNGAGTFTSGNPAQSTLAGIDPTKPLGGLHAGKPHETASHFADATSWGYQLLGRLTYNNLIGAIAVSPRFAWSHDVDGITPGPGGSFLAGRKAVTMGASFEHPSQITADVAYTNFFGAGRHNLLNDRDFFAFNVKYSF